MKQYSNTTRKPMMYGGDSRMKRRDGSTDQGEKKAKADAMANAEAQSRIATGRATPADKKADDEQRREEISRMPMADIRKMAAGTGRDAVLAGSVLRAKGEGRPAPQEKAYGGKSMKKK